MRYVLCSLSFLTSVATADDLPEPGLYELHVAVSSAILPVDQEHRSEQCLTEAQITDPQKYLARHTQGQECETDEFQVSDGDIAFRLQCNLPTGPTRLTGQGAYDKQSFRIDGVMTSKMGLFDIETKSSVSAKRRGPC